MVTVSKNPVDSQLPLIDRLLHSPLLQKLQAKQKELYYALLVFLFLLGSTFFWLHKSKKTDLENYQLASSYANELMKSSSFNTQKEEEVDEKKSADNFTRLQALVKSDPLIKERYNGLIAEWLLLKEQKKEFAAFADHAIRTLSSSKMPYFARFSKISALTLENRLKEAFEEAHQLEKSLEEHNGAETNATLYAFTLLQEVALLHALGFHDRAQKTVEKLKKNIAASDPSSRFVLPENERSQFVQHLQEQEALLLDFLAQGKTS